MTGAPQSAEQIGIFGPYCIWNGDFALDEKIDLSSWDLSAPAHLNLRFEEPITEKVFNRSFIFSQKHFPFKLFVNCTPLMQNWIQNVNYPFVIVGALVNKEIPNVKKFLINLKAPVYLEATSGLREDPELQSFRVNFPDSILKASRKANYPIDGILRLGGVPTLRLWRDLEEMEGRIKLCSISSIPFPGISWGGFFHASLEHLHIHECTPKGKEWIENDRIARKEMIDILEQEPLSEPSMLYQLSLKIPEGAFVYLGNSLPIREWDLCAGKRCFTYAANRGLNGIDGQISTFLGMCRPDQENWAIIGDLTALYDLAALWILPQMEGMNIRIVIINNKGGKIFSRLFKNSQFQNLHNLDFASLAQFWKISYEKWEKVPTIFSNTPQLLIELSPNEDSSQRFWQKYDQM